MGLETDIEIRLLGLPELLRPAAGNVFPAKGFQLLALLARAPTKRLSRKELASLLWDNDTDSAALGNLRQLLARVKRAGSAYENLIDADTKTVALGDGAAMIDLNIFEIGYRSGSPEQALRSLMLFRGELLEGISDVTDAFSHWLTLERTALRDRFFAAASSLLIELTRYGRASDQDLRAIADQMLSLDPEREASYRTLIEAYGRNGMYEDAERIFQALGTMLEREFGVPPQPETSAVLRRVLAGRGYHPSVQTETKPVNTQPRVAFLAPSWIGPVGSSALLGALIEDVANELSRYRTFVALAPHSSFKLQHDSGVPVDNTALRADYTVSGFVKPSEREQLLVLRMADCRNGDIMWAGEFSFQPEDLTRSFRMLSLRVASSIATSVERHMLENMRRDGSHSAYLQYLEGQQLLKNCDLPKLRRARKAFVTAAELNKDMALAHARIAQTLYLEWIMRGGNDPELLHDARGKAEHATHIDPNGGFGHLMAGTVALYQRDFDISSEKFAVAETLNPNSADLLVQHADALSHLGEVDSAKNRFERAIDLNPMAPDHYWWAGACIAFQQHDYAGAVTLCGKMESETSVVRLLAAAHAFLGNKSLAHNYWMRVRDLYPDQDPAMIGKIAPFKHDEFRIQIEQGLRMAAA